MSVSRPRFRDRAAAGAALARALSALAKRPDVVVLGMARGGVPVARQVADALAAPLDVAVARKLGVPGIEEVALGAIAEGSSEVVGDPVGWYLGVPHQVVSQIAARERAELERHSSLYRAGRALAELRGRTVVLVDDGLATGATLRAAALTLRRRRPARLVIAVPVACAKSAVELRREVDELVALLTPETCGTVSDWYEDFEPVSDAEVLRILGRSAGVAPERATTLSSNPPTELAVPVPADACSLTGDLGMPNDRVDGPKGLVILAHGGGSSRNSYRNRYLAGRLRLAGFATLRLDLLTAAEQAKDAGSGELRFEVTRIARRLIAASEWATGESIPGAERIVLMGASTGAAAALVAAAERPALVSAVVARGGRVDLAGEALTRVVAPVLLVVGSADRETLQWNREAMRSLPDGARLAVVSGAGHAFEEAGALGAVGEHVVQWLAHLHRAGRTTRLLQRLLSARSPRP